MIPRRIRGPALVSGLVLLAVVAGLQVETARPPAGSPVEVRPEKVMSTSARLIAVPPGSPGDRGDAPDATRALQAAEAVLREVEALMSSHIDASAVSRLNRASMNERVPLPPPVLEVLGASQQLYEASDHAFDITCGPVFGLWRAAQQSGRLPDRAELAAARRGSSWNGLLLTAEGAIKHSASVNVDLGAIAKGYAIDRATSALQQGGMAGGLVDVGGDLRVFGTPPQGTSWMVKVQNPLGEGTILTLALPQGAVCTSGSYHRYAEIDGHRYSHIIDPRTAWPVQGVASVTVLADQAITADAWATALSVLGSDGLRRLPEGVEALLVVGEQEALQTIATPGFQAKMETSLPYPLQIHAERGGEQRSTSDRAGAFSRGSPGAMP